MLLLPEIESIKVAAGTGSGGPGMFFFEEYVIIFIQMFECILEVGANGGEN